MNLLKWRVAIPLPNLYGMLQTTGLRQPSQRAPRQQAGARLSLRVPGRRRTQADVCLTNSAATCAAAAVVGARSSSAPAAGGGRRPKMMPENVPVRGTALLQQAPPLYGGSCPCLLHPQRRRPAAEEVLGCPS